MDTRNGFPMFVEYQSISRFNDNVISNQSVTNQVVSFFFFCFRFIDRNYLYLCEKFVIFVGKYRIVYALNFTLRMIRCLSYLYLEYFYNAIFVIQLKFML